MHILRRQEEAGVRFLAGTSLEKLDATSASLEHELKCVETAYEITLAAARRALEMARQDKRVAPRPLWFVGSHLKHFTDLLSGMGFYLWKANATFARDLGISESSMEKIRSFYARFPEVLGVDPNIPWNRYRENKVPFRKPSP